jgi:hypothetical protein
MFPQARGPADASRRPPRPDPAAPRRLGRCAGGPRPPSRPPGETRGRSRWPGGANPRRCDVGDATTPSAVQPAGSVGSMSKSRPIRSGRVVGSDRLGQPLVVGLASDVEYPARHRHGDSDGGQPAQERGELRHSNILPGHLSASHLRCHLSVQQAQTSSVRRWSSCCRAAQHLVFMFQQLDPSAGITQFGRLATGHTGLGAFVDLGLAQPSGIPVTSIARAMRSPAASCTPTTDRSDTHYRSGTPPRVRGGAHWSRRRPGRGSWLLCCLDRLACGRLLR